MLFAPLFAPLGVGAENAHQIDSVSDLSSVQKAYIDPKTHDVFVENEDSGVTALEERSYQTGSKYTSPSSRERTPANENSTYRSS